jgi:hypothetical protein
MVHRLPIHEVYSRIWYEPFGKELPVHPYVADDERLAMDNGDDG